MKFKIGDKIPVKVDGVQYETIIDKDGVQRFVSQCKMLRRILDMELIDCNTLGRFLTADEYSEFARNIEYSVSGFAELNCNEEREIENPLWDEKD